MKRLALSIGGEQVTAPRGVPTGGLDRLADVIQGAIAVLFFFAIVFALFVLVISGFQWMFSSGDKQKLQQARQRIVYAIVGLSLIFLSILIMRVLGAFFGVDFLNLPTT